MATTEKPPLPDGLVIVLKEECATCRLVVPVVAHVAAATPTTVVVQDDAGFLGELPTTMDSDLALSWHHEIETVPTVIRVEGGQEVERTIGWSRAEWERVTGLEGLGPDLPAMRPGCGSMSVDPNLVDELRARFSGSTLRARRIELASLEDEFEALFDRGWTDGLPVIPPTETRVLRMLEGTSHAPSEVVCVVAPDLAEVTVEKVAINAVMAGCKPEHLPWVLSALGAVCTDEFNIHGVLATTMPVGPVIVCNGPGTKAVGMNTGVNVMGQGNRATLTIGRAVQLVVRNVGGGRPGGVDRATHGNPGKLSFCFAEDEVGSPWSSLATSRGVGPGVDAVTAFAGEGPKVIVDQLSRTPESLASSLGAALRSMHHPKLVLAFDVILVIGPDHARVFADAGWDRERLLGELMARVQMDGKDIVRGAGGIAEGVPEAMRDHTLPKFRPNGILLVHAGGGAGLFSMMIGGWANGAMGSVPVTKPVTWR